MESQDKCIVMSSVVENFGLHLPTRENGKKKPFSKIGFYSGELSDKCIVMSSVVKNFGLHSRTREKREKCVFKNQIPLRKVRRAFRSIEKCLS